MNLIDRGKKCPKQRILGLDIIRSLAILFVIAGHFFSLHTKYGNTPLEGISMFIQACFPPLFYIGVPLFIMMTGYLNTNKTVVDKKYCKGMARILIAYLFFSVVTLLFKKYYLMEDISFQRAIGGILRYDAILYGWYIEMWIGLYLFTPFLNLLYKAISTKQQKLIGIGILFAMTALPDLNYYGFHLVPGFWKSCFPLMFFFIGSYIKEYQPQIKSLYGWGIIIVCCLINPIFNVLFVHDRLLIHIIGGPFGALGTLIAVIFFLLVYQKDIKVSLVRKIFTKVSLLSLDIYLCCYIFDAIYYPYFKEQYFINQSQFGMFFFLIVPLVFLSSLTLAQIKEWLFKIARINYLWK